MANIKQIKMPGSSTAYDIEALHFKTGSLDTPASWKTYIDDLVGKGLQIVIDTKHASKEEPATAPSASTMGKLYMVTLTGQLSGTYTEFVTVNPSGSTYAWEKIGTTEVDLSNYPKKGKYQSEDSDTPNTGSTVGQAANTNTSNVSAGTVDFTKAGFTGTKATISANVTGIAVAAHAAATLNVSGSQTVAAHSHTVNVDRVQLKYASIDQSDTVTVLASSGTEVERNTNGEGDHTHTLTYATTPTEYVSGITGAVSATVSGEILTITEITPSKATFSQVTGMQTNGSHMHKYSIPGTTAATVLRSINDDGGFLIAADESEPYVVISSTNTINTNSANEHTINGSNFKAALPTLTHTVSNAGSISVEYTPAGSITGSTALAAHSHTYTAPAAHSHTISHKHIVDLTKNPVA